MRKFALSVVSVLILFSMVLTACATPTAAPTAAAPTAEVKIVEKTVVVTQEVKVETKVEVPVAAAERVQVYWYIGLGAGAQPAQIEAEKVFIEKYNKSQTEIQLIPIIVDNNYARDNLIAQIAAGNSPDIVGPVGTKGRGFFPGAFMDLTPMVEKFKYDLSDVDPKFLEFYKDEGTLVGLPFAIFPSFLWVNKTLLEEAGLDMLPQKFGDKYTIDGKEYEWNFDTLKLVAMKLTVDAKGNDATSPDFDPTNIVQWGFDWEWTDARGIATSFGAGIPVADGKAVLPAGWGEAWQWYYEGMWKEHFIPTQANIDSDLIKGNEFGSGKVAIVHCHMWFTCCTVPETNNNIDIAVVPAYNGVYTAKMHGDTFSILKDSKNPEAAFKVLTYMLGEGSADLYSLYGGMPARASQQADFFAGLDKTFEKNSGKINWQVAVDSMPYVDAPNHEAGLPNFAKADDAIAKFTSDMRSNDKLDITARIGQLITDLDTIYQEVKK